MDPRQIFVNIKKKMQEGNFWSLVALFVWYIVVKTVQFVLLMLSLDTASRVVDVVSWVVVSLAIMWLVSFATGYSKGKVDIDAIMTHSSNYVPEPILTIAKKYETAIWSLAVLLMSYIAVTVVPFVPLLLSLNAAFWLVSWMLWMVVLWGAVLLAIVRLVSFATGYSKANVYIDKMMTQSCQYVPTPISTMVKTYEKDLWTLVVLLVWYIVGKVVQFVLLILNPSRMIGAGLWVVVLLAIVWLVSFAPRFSKVKVYIDEMTMKSWNYVLRPIFTLAQ